MAAAKKPVAKKTKKTEIMPEEAIENTTPIEMDGMTEEAVEGTTPIEIEDTPVKEDNPVAEVNDADIIDGGQNTEEAVEENEPEVEAAPEPEVENNSEPEPIPEAPVKEEKKEEPKVEKKPEVKKVSPKLRTSYNHMGMIYSW